MYLVLLVQLLIGDRARLQHPDCAIVRVLELKCARWKRLRADGIHHRHAGEDSDRLSLDVHGRPALPQSARDLDHGDPIAEPVHPIGRGKTGEAGTADQHRGTCRLGGLLTGRWRIVHGAFRWMHLLLDAVVIYRV